MTKARDLATAASAFDTVTVTELEYIDGVTSAVQTQLNAKQAIVSGVDDTEIGYLNGVTSAIQTQMDTKLASATAATTYSPLNLTQNAQTGTTYTFVLADNSKLVTASNASAQTYSIPTNASVAFPIGTQINIIAIGTGQVTINAVTSGTTTVLSNGGTAAAPKLRVQYSSATCIKVATDTWYVVGDLS
jgi:hypothetical protein